MKSEGDLVEGIPEGFEVYENPNARVFLRKVQPKIITDEGVEVVKRGLGQSRHLRRDSFFEL
jgi:hypothetical protein